MERKFYEKFEKKANHKNTKKDLKKQQRDFNNSDNPKEKKSSQEKNDFKQKASNHPVSKTTKDFKNSKRNKKEDNFKKEQSLFTTDKITKETDYILQHFDEIVQGVRPLNSKQLQQLPDNIKELSHQLTDKRSERRLGYMNDNIQLSSYVRYYTWWNLVRLTRLFSNLPASAFPNKDGVCIDLGTGPLTVVNALWLARPELRKLNLTWYCLDVSSNSMVLGEDLYMSIAARTPASTPAPAGETTTAGNSLPEGAPSQEDSDSPSHWNIIRVKGSFGTSIKQKADFITCANMFNELDQAGDMPPEYQAKKYFQQLQTYGKQDCKFLLIEPGVPKATRTLTLLRERFINAGKTITSPCPHHLSCPMNGFKAYTGSSNKWCNFCFSTEDAPARLLKLSEQAKLPKERATLIFVSAVGGDKMSAGAREAAGGSKMSASAKDTVGGDKAPRSLSNNHLTCRVTSDPFRLPDYKIGYYGCSQLGLTLIKTNGKVERNPNAKQKGVINHEKEFIIKGPLASGDLIQIKIKKAPDQLPIDEKSGAVVVEL